jgi:hypothetical protein
MTKKKNIFLNIPFRFVPIRTSEWTIPRHGIPARSTFFWGITKTVLSLFRRIFSERNFHDNPNNHFAANAIHFMLCNVSVQTESQPLVYNQGGYQGAANPDKSFSHGQKGSTVYKVSVAQLQLQGKIFRLFSPYSPWDTFRDRIY